MFMHKYTTDELKTAVWKFMANGYSDNANRALYQLFDAGVIELDDAHFWVR